MNQEKQHEVLSAIKEKLILHFNMNEHQIKGIDLYQDKEKTQWFLNYDWYCVFSFGSFKGEELLSVSFDMDTDPEHAAIIMSCLLKNNFDVHVFESYWFDPDDEEMYWGEEAEERHMKTETPCDDIVEIKEMLEDIMRRLEDVEVRPKIGNN
jgi:hypothetical protein